MFQNKHCRSKGENTMKVTLKDGSVKRIFRTNVSK